MANIKSAKKRYIQSLKRRDRNRNTKGACRSAVKKTRAAIIANDKPEAEKSLKLAEKLIATAATKKVYHKKTAARLVSRLSQAVHRMG
ncbi:MAG: 30S ribosomal protein S20 [Bdellovibrionales bacterium]|nr:30S ribosomal protein S20 [Bdellovibrionales bacterium]